MVEYNPRDQVHEKSLELFDEFEQHYQEFIKVHPDRNDRHRIFEAWVVQKIADLQLTVFKRDLFVESEDFQCQQCGLCCQVFCGTEIEITEKDLDRWMLDGREDILEWVDSINFGDHVEHDFPIHPTKNTQVDRCPFLEKLPHKDIYICKINDTKPTGCREFPTSREKAQSINCPGVIR